MAPPPPSPAAPLQLLLRLVLASGLIPNPSSCPPPCLEAPRSVPSISAASSLGSSSAARLHSPMPSGCIRARDPCRSIDDVAGGQQEADADLQAGLRALSC